MKIGTVKIGLVKIGTVKIGTAKPIFSFWRKLYSALFFYTKRSIWIEFVTRDFSKVYCVTE